MLCPLTKTVGDLSACVLVPLSSVAVVVVRIGNIAIQEGGQVVAELEVESSAYILHGRMRLAYWKFGKTSSQKGLALELPLTRFLMMP